MEKNIFNLMKLLRNVSSIYTVIFVDLWVNNTAYCKSIFLQILDPVTSLLSGAKTCSVWLLARLGWSPPQPQQPSRQA